MLDIFQEIYGSLMRNKMRTIATGFAVASGLFLIIVLQGAGNGLIHSFEVNRGDFVFDVIDVYGGKTTMPFEGMKEGRQITLDERDIAMTKQTFSSRVKTVLPVVKQGNAVVVREGKSLGASLKGVHPDYQASQAVKILEGRFINNIDMEQKRKVVVISSGSAQEYLYKKGESPVNSILTIDGMNYKVVGVYKANEMFSNVDFYVPFTTLSIIYGKGRTLDQITMNVKNMPEEYQMLAFVSDYTRVSSMIHSYDPKDESALWMWNQAKENLQMNIAMTILRTAFWLLGLLTLISGVVGVSNIMLISVKERTREFGIRRAIGARPRNIISMVMLESVVVTGIFGYIGMLLGVFFCEWMDYAAGGQTMDLGMFQAKYFVDPTVDISICVTATVIIVIAGALAGFFPARKAVKVKPIDALRG